MKFLILLFLFIPFPLLSTSMIFTNINESIYQENKFQYEIQAKIKVENFKKDVKLLFFNRKKYVSENFYYENGSVMNTKYDISFKRMFVYGQNIYLNQVRGSFFKYTFHAKNAVIYKDKIVFSHIFFKTSHKQGSRLNFIYFFNKKNEIEKA